MTDEENEELKKILASSSDEIEISISILQNASVVFEKALEDTIQSLLQSMEIIYDKYYKT